MKKVKKYSLLSVIILSLLAFNYCSLDGDCYEQVEVPVKRLVMPDSIPLDSTLAIDIIYVTYNNCSNLNQILYAQSGDTISVHILADYKGCSCPEELPDSIATFSFKPGAVRDYIFRAWKYDNNILQDTLKIYDNSSN